jgi:O-acetyl-ADP-ribose deacetylase (regulator of RNase III)
MFEAYRAMCRAEPRQFNPGDCFLWRAENQPWVFNLATQDGTRGKVRATYDAVEAALRAMRQQADEAGIRSIAMPRIGAGLGGLEWEPIREIIDHVFTDWDGTLIVYETYIDEGRAA